MNLDLYSQRLVLAPFVPDDLGFSYEVLADPTVVKYTGGVTNKQAILPMPIEEDDTNYSLVVRGKMPNGDIEIGDF